MKKLLVAAAAIIAAATIAQPAFAYVGPGAGLSLLGALWGLLLALLAATAFVVGWPVRRWLSRRRAAASGDVPAAAAAGRPDPSRPAQPR
jgi:hypothetical protein